METPTKVWQSDLDDIREALNNYTHQINNSYNLPNRVSRVSQLDAQVLDTELHDILQLQFNKIFSFFEENVYMEYKPEMFLLLNVLLFRISIWSIHTTYGMSLQNLKLDINPNTKNKVLTLYFILDVIVPYIRSRLSIYAQKWVVLPDSDPKKMLWKFIKRAEEIWKILKFINFLVFMYNGKYSNIMRRLLSLRMVPLRPTARRVSFEYMNRQLIWNAFTEFMLFVMPLINVDYLKDKWKSITLIGRRAVDNTKCVICDSTSISVPYTSTMDSCGHCFCYVCIYQKISSQSNYKCPSCGISVKSIKRFVQ
eukprot:TRINITY_DN7117_c0_g1_i1.p1 TRINITY_DN7117_c0_g1~~TRINITY_DN7117_c0_g1_i1.p1  ORF type:complete len:310 (+),score=28.09 TRINITY_DN7117_c0_g1_i1:1-930(+)